ncbi:hypothetical protein [Streptomyces sp. NPDC057301]|uniref:hypothetical protein n=1 Tax=Streptomyces sp. NPDC057301 TaxID=3346093 RepID=UPI00363A2B84
MRKITRKRAAIAAAVAIGVAGVVGTATLAQATSNAASPEEKAKPPMAEPVPVNTGGTAVSDRLGEGTPEQQRVIVNIVNRSGQKLTLLKSSTLSNAPFRSDGGYRVPKSGDALKGGSEYAYLNTVDLPNAALKTTTTWKIGAGTTMTVFQASTEAGPACEFSGAKAADYACKVSLGSGGGHGTDITEIVVSQR